MPQFAGCPAGGQQVSQRSPPNHLDLNGRFLKQENPLVPQLLLEHPLIAITRPTQAVMYNSLFIVVLSLSTIPFKLKWKSDFVCRNVTHD